MFLEVFLGLTDQFVGAKESLAQCFSHRARAGSKAEAEGMKGERKKTI